MILHGAQGPWWVQGIAAVYGALLLLFAVAAWREHDNEDRS